METISQSKALIERIYWLIKLRWFAVIGVALTVSFVDKVLKIPLPVFSLYTITVLFGLYNLLFLIYLKLLKKGAAVNLLTITNRLANIQISFDLVSLISLIHFSGGIENPFIFYFIFHMIIASILLSRRASFFQATFAIIIFCLTVILEYFSILPHYCLRSFLGFDLHKNLVYISGIWFVVITTLYIAVYMASSISLKLRQREAILEEANALLEEKDRIKSEYVLWVSHDIKEHLSSIQGCLEPVVAGITGGLNSKQFDLIERANKRASNLMLFVKALLEITRLKLSKEMRMDYFSFKALLSEVIANIMPKAKDKNISVNSIVDANIDKIRGSKEYIEGAIANLLANSLKYTPRNGKLDIAVSDRGNSILIKITDTGIGIPKQDLPKVFDEFYRAKNAKDLERDGTGLGLSIVKQVVQRHNGEIWVESQEGKGTTFSITLPK